MAPLCRRPESAGTVAVMCGRPASAYDVLVVGAGHNGLVCAYYLARAGRRVGVIERRDVIGGACVTEELFPGYRGSSCSYLCWMLEPTVIADLGLRRRGFETRPLDPMAFNPYADGSFFFTRDDPGQTQAEIARLNAHDSAALPAWDDFWRRASLLLEPFILRAPPTDAELWEHARTIGEESLLATLQGSSLTDVCATFFEDSRVSAALVQVEDVGDPWAPGSAWAEAHFHTNGHTGLGYSVVVGGMGAITTAMAEAAVEAGATITPGAPVQRILIDDGRVRGVRLANGREVRAPVVVSNADPKRTLVELIDRGELSEEYLAAIAGTSTRQSYLKFHSVMRRLPDISAYLGRRADPREACSIRIAPSLETFQTAHFEATAGQPASRPIVHIQIPSVYDETLPRRDGYLVSIWAMYAPPKLASGSWPDRREEVGEALIDYVTEFVPNFRSDLEAWMLLTPHDLEDRLALTDGNIRHLDMVPEQLLSHRPLRPGGYATPVGGLYLCGAGTHPGGEVTGAPGHNAAQAILRSHAPDA
jgi:phytoene dehydrogenase-like protein